MAYVPLTPTEALREASSWPDAGLPLPTLLDRLARLAVRVLADWSLIDLVGTDGSIRREAAAHRDPDYAGVVRLLRVHSLVPAIVHEVVRTGDARSDNLATVSWVEGVGPDTGQRSLLRELGHGSVLVVPVCVEGEVFGTLTLVAQRAERFSDADLELACSLAQCSGEAVRRARSG